MLCALSNTGGTHVSLGLGHTAGAEILQGDVWDSNIQPELRSYRETSGIRKYNRS